MIVLQTKWVESVLPELGLEGKLVLSILLLLGYLFTVWLVGKLRPLIDRRERVVNAVLAVSLAGLLAVLGLVLVAIWGDELDGITAFSFLDVANPAQATLTAILTVFMLVGVYVLTGFVKESIYRLTEDSNAVTKHQTEVLFRSTQVTLYAVALLIVLSIWNVNLGGLLVGAGFLGIVLGLAAQQTLGSLIAGFVLMFARPFEIGDWVKIGDREGIVTEISIVNTRIQTFDGEYAMIPNDIVSSTEIVNRTRKGRLRIRVEVGVDYATDLELAADTATEAMRDLEEILTVPQPQVVLKEFADSAIVFELRFWIDKPTSRRRWRARTAVIQAVKQAFDEEDIKIPFPQRELMGRSEAGGFRLADEAGDPSSTIDPPEE